MPLSASNLLRLIGVGRVESSRKISLARKRISFVGICLDIGQNYLLPLPSLAGEETDLRQLTCISVNSRSDMAYVVAPFG